MSRLGFTGAELGHINLEPISSSGTVEVVTNPVRSGARAFRARDNTANYIEFVWTKTANRWFYSRCWFRIIDLPTSNNPIARITEGGTVLHTVSLQTNGKLLVQTSGSSESATVVAGVWNCLEIGAWGDGASSKRVIVRLNGVQFADQSVATTPTVYGDRVRYGFVAGGNQGRTIWLDDFALNDDQGAANNSWPGTNGGVAVLLPDSDSAIHNDWNLGTNAEPAGKAYDAVNNRPPQGVADLAGGSDKKQIRNPIGGSDFRADFNMQSYASVAPDGTTVKSIQSVVAVSRSGSPSLDFGVISNPVESYPSPVVPSSGIAGNYPTGWFTHRNPVVSAPTVDLETQPVMRVGKFQSTTSASVLMCCFAGIHFDIEPSPPPTPVAERIFMGAA